MLLDSLMAIVLDGSISREMIDTTRFLGYECILLEEVIESPDLFQPEIIGSLDLKK